MTGWQIQIFYDGACPVCMREVEMLRRMDRHARILFTDIAAPEFDAAAWGRDLDTFMKRIQGRLPDGSWVEGVEVFRHVYGAVGFGWAVPLTRLPGVRALLDWAYDRFAANRLRWTGRCLPDGECRVPSR